METARVRLTLLRKEDFPEVLKMFNEPGTAKYIRHLQNLSMEEYEAILNKRLIQIEAKSGFHWTARLKNGKNFIGALNLSPIPNTELMQLGFQLSPKFWNQGFASEMAKEVVEFGIRELGLKIIYGVIEEGNIASGKVLERLGFKADETAILEEKGVVVYRFDA